MAWLTPTSDVQPERREEHDADPCDEQPDQTRVLGQPLGRRQRASHAGKGTDQSQETEESERADPAGRRDAADEVDPVAPQVGLSRFGGPQPRDELSDEDAGGEPLERVHHRLGV
jgi:hypothetical protein